MKNILLLLLTVALLASCGEDEKELTPQLQTTDFYVIKDNPADSIQHRVYQIYEQYGVPVYFNDTIGRTFVRTDIYGDSVFVYETLDLGWGFTSHNYLSYKFEYMTDPALQSQYLDIVEEFLKRTSKKIYPFAIMLADYAITDDGRGSRKTLKYQIGFRVIYISNLWKEEELVDLPHMLQKELVEDRIQNFPDDVAPFGKVSDKNWYGGKSFAYLDPTVNSIVPNPFESWGYPNPLQFSVNILEDDWEGMYYFENGFFNPDELEVLRKNVRLKLGQFGFISGNKTLGGQFAPQTTSDDLSDYVSVMVNCTPAEFEALWGECPLVMKKYNIIREVLRNRLEVEL